MINFDYLDKKLGLTPNKTQIAASKKHEPVNWVPYYHLFRIAPAPRWNDRRLGNYDPLDGQPSRYYRQKTFNKPGVCHWCGKRVYKTNNRQPKYHNKCQKIVTELNKSDSKNRIRGLRRNLGTVPANGLYFQFHLIKWSKNSVELKELAYNLKWTNQDDIKPIGIPKIVADNYCDECHCKYERIPTPNGYHNEYVCPECGLVRE